MKIRAFSDAFVEVPADDPTKVLISVVKGFLEEILQFDVLELGVHDLTAGLVPRY